MTKQPFDAKEFWEDWDADEVVSELETELRSKDNGRVFKLLFMAIMNNTHEVNRLNKILKFGAPLFIGAMSLLVTVASVV